MQQLMRAGMDVARLNFSHGTHEDHALVIERLRRVAKQEGRTICILQDLQGPKMRTGALRDGKPVMLAEGSRITITTRREAGSASRISTDFASLPHEVEPGSQILLSDGRLALKVLSKGREEIHCRVVNGGMLAEHQGINLPGTLVSVPSLTEKDIKDLRFGLKHGVDVVAVSFVRTAGDVREVKRRIAGLGYDVPVIAKLEKPQAIDNLEEIFQYADGVMVARGDLGVEVPPEKVPVIQKHVIRRALEWRKPVITATQMLESMITNPRPTRAEASDVANAILDGTDAVMLSAETASGKYPREAVEMMARIAVEAEAHRMTGAASHRRVTGDGMNVSEAICESVAHMAEELKLRAIAVYTESGTTARLISKYRPRAEVYAFAHEPSICNRMNLFWGVRPVAIDQVCTVEDMVVTAEGELQQRGIVAPGDVLAIVAGTQTTSGSTDFIRLHRVTDAARAGGGTQRARQRGPAKRGNSNLKSKV